MLVVSIVSIYHIYSTLQLLCLLFLPLIEDINVGDKRCGHTLASHHSLSFGFDIFVLPVLHAQRTYSTVTGRNALENTDSPFSGNQHIHLTTTFSRSFPLFCVHTVITITKQSQVTSYNFHTRNRAELNLCNVFSLYVLCGCYIAGRLVHRQELGMGFCLFTGLKSREERSKQYFDTALDQDFSQGADWEVDNIDQQFGLASASGHLSQQQLLLLEEDNTRMAARREHEVRQIVKSIVDLNDIFKDLAQMVADQVIIIPYELHYIRTY